MLSGHFVIKGFGVDAFNNPVCYHGGCIKNFSKLLRSFLKDTKVNKIIVNFGRANNYDSKT